MEWHEVIDELEKQHTGDLKAKEILFLCALGRLVKNKKPYSFNVIVLSSSSSGKDHLVDSILKLFPEEDYEKYGRVSKRVLNYLHSKEEGFSWDGKILALEEIEEAILNSEVMKVFTAGTTKSAIVGDKKNAVVLEVKGKPVVFTTTATTIPNEEILNRFNIVKIDESEEQTRKTFLLEEEEDYSGSIKDFLKGLESKEVDIPFKNKIAKVFPTSKTRYRRDFQRFCDFIKSFAVFNQAERVGRDGDSITAQIEDYDKARDCFANVFRGVSAIPLKAVDSKIIKTLEGAELPLSAKHICSALQGRINQKNVYIHLDNLKAKGFIESVEERDSFGNAITKYELSEEYKDNSPINLPNGIDLLKTSE